MNVVSSRVVRVAFVAATCLLTQCSLPPRDAWRIVQTDGLVPYLLGEHPPVASQNRYLAMASPLQHNVQHFPRIPYRPPNAQSRYMADVGPSQPQVGAPPYRPPTYTAPRQKKSTVNLDAGDALVTDLDRVDSLLTPKSKAKDKTADSSGKLAMDELPFGSPVGGRPGMVNSPFATKDQLVDVTGMSVGETVKCPYSGKLFRVPPTQQAASKSKTDTSAPPEPPEEPVKSAPESKPTPPAEPKSSLAPEPEKPAADPVPTAPTPPADTAKPKA